MRDLVAKITNSELEIMRVLWAAGRDLPVAEIRKIMEETSPWEASTIKTLLRRLQAKGAIAAQKKGVYYYTPLVGEEDYNHYVTKALINRLYSGSAKKLVASPLGNSILDAADVAELRQLLEADNYDDPNH